MTRYGVLMYEYLDGDTPLIGSRVFESEERAQRFAFQVAGRGERRADLSVATVALACVWECDANGGFVRATGDEFEG